MATRADAAKKGEQIGEKTAVFCGDHSISFSGLIERRLDTNGDELHEFSRMNAGIGCSRVTRVDAEIF